MLYSENQGSRPIPNVGMGAFDQTVSNLRDSKLNSTDQENIFKPSNLLDI
jgi:hypothetical protein